MVMCFAIWFILKLEIKMNKKFEYQWSILHLSKCWTKNVTRNYLRCERKNFHLQMARDIRRKQNRLYTIVYLKRYKLKMIKVNLSSFTILIMNLDNKLFLHIRTKGWYKVVNNWTWTSATSRCVCFSMTSWTISLPISLVISVILEKVVIS